MPPAKIHASDAARQAAYRARHREREPVRQGLLAGLARTLHGELEAAVQEGRSCLPADLLGCRADETLRQLIRYLQTEGKEAEAGSDDPNVSTTD